MRAPVTPVRWHRFAKVALLGIMAIASIPFIIVALIGGAGARRS